MEGEAPVQASQSTTWTHTPESLRQRQRDRLSPRGRFTNPDRIPEDGGGSDATPTTARKLSPAPLKKKTVNRSLEAIKKRKLQDGLRKENSINRRAKREAEEVKYDIAPDGSSAAREGRQFTVAKVGNNGKIYLR